MTREIAVGLLLALAAPTPPGAAAPPRGAFGEVRASAAAGVRFEPIERAAGGSDLRATGLANARLAAAWSWLLGDPRRATDPARFPRAALGPALQVGNAGAQLHLGLDAQARFPLTRDGRWAGRGALGAFARAPRDPELDVGIEAALALDRAGRGGLYAALEHFVLGRHRGDLTFGAYVVLAAPRGAR